MQEPWNNLQCNLGSCYNWSLRMAMIAPFELGFDPASARKFPQGADSVVYSPGEGKVFKVYRPDIPLSLVERYQEVTNAASNFLRNQPMTGTVKIDERRFTFEPERKKGFDMVYVVNPIDEVSVSSSGQVVAVSQFVPGVRMEDLLWRPKKGIVSERELKGLTDPSERKYLGGRVSLMRELQKQRQWSFGVGVMDEPDPSLESVNDSLESALRVKGINAVPLNVRLRINPRMRQIQFMITDLAARLSGDGMEFV